MLVLLIIKLLLLLMVRLVVVLKVHWTRLWFCLKAPWTLFTVDWKEKPKWSGTCPGLLRWGAKLSVLKCYMWFMIDGIALAAVVLVTLPTYFVSFTHNHSFLCDKLTTLADVSIVPFRVAVLKKKVLFTVLLLPQMNTTAPP